MLCSKLVLVFLTILLGFTNTCDGQQNKKYFRHDYTFLSLSNGFYKVNQNPRNWSEANIICGLEGASLFYPESITEAEEVLKFGYETYKDKGHKIFFVGIHDILGNGGLETVDGK